MKSKRSKGVEKERGEAVERVKHQTILPHLEYHDHNGGEQDDSEHHDGEHDDHDGGGDNFATHTCHLNTSKCVVEILPTNYCNMIKI